MAVLLSYHRLIEKDSQHVSYCWKMSILAVLAVAVASSLVISFSLYSLWESFRLNCFMGASLSFVISKGSGLREVMQTNRSEKERQILYKLLQSTALDEKYIISEYDSKWSNPDFCEYLTYTPLFHALLGVIWAALFVTHGHGGEGVGSIIARPWRIVIPSLTFFTICGISAIVCASLVSSGLAKFCQQFNKINSTADIDCARMITYFSMIEANDLVLPDKNYYLITVFPWIWASSYICGAIVLLLRIVLVVDFKLVRVVVSTIERDMEPEESGQPNVEVLNEATQVSVEDVTAQ
ncbi:uncharacterized protein LOC135703609 [Ochlerotatus camptorhynchus]|uniref:uncharacterized protein LOC135703609 n=1 Tax=Ochlerotatus camptorhynchus TaxID=644619 RepID=UPI0031E08202